MRAAVDSCGEMEGRGKRSEDCEDRRESRNVKYGLEEKVSFSREARGLGWIVSQGDG